MLSIFNRANKSTPITIKIDRDKLIINQKVVELPTTIEELEKHLGVPTKTSGNEIYWKNLGISTNPHKNGQTNHLTLHVDYNPMESKSKNEQKPFFNGKISIDGVEINTKRFNNVTSRKYEVKQFTYSGEKSPCLISISYNKIFDNNLVKPELTKNKYNIQKSDEERIEFSDFGFKLAIVQELMYNKELLKPKFELVEFIKWYDKREIDLEKEGYKPIPEVTQYFKDLPIPKSLAPEIEEIYQDGGNDIYMQLLRFGEGTEDYWDIKTAKDALKFPNLNKVVLCYAKDNVIGEFNDMGIEAHWL